MAKETKKKEEVIIQIPLEEGVDLACRALCLLHVAEKDYIVVTPVESNEEEMEIYIYHYSESETGEPIIENLDSDEEYDIVYKRFDEVKYKLEK